MLHFTMFLHRKCKLHTLALLKWNGCFHDKSSESVSLRHLCCFQIDRTVFSPLFTQFLSPIQLHRITWFFRGTKRFTIILFLSIYEFYRNSLKSKNRMAKTNPSKNQKVKFLFQMTIFLILIKVSVSPVAHEPKIFPL